MDTLDLGYILPTDGWIRDFHPLTRVLTGAEKQKTEGRLDPLLLSVAVFTTFFAEILLFGAIHLLTGNAFSAGAHFRRVPLLCPYHGTGIRRGKGGCTGAVLRECQAADGAGKALLPQCAGPAEYPGAQLHRIQCCRPFRGGLATFCAERDRYAAAVSGRCGAADTLITPTAFTTLALKHERRGFSKREIRHLHEPSL